jgi:hypothetical protein
LDKTKYAGKPSAYVMDVAEMKAKSVLKSVFKGGRDISDLLVVGTVSYILLMLVATSVADPGCLSRIPDLGSRIQKQQQKRGVKKKSYLFM